MDVTLERPEVVTSDDLIEQNFSIGDAAMVITILRSKLYSNPIKTVIQEIASNARDANRENNVPDNPVRIKLPNVYDNVLRISDDGIGITPNRMAKVFIQYGNSTKRGTNLTGGFGIGAKSMFAYTDTFNISTTTNEDGLIWTREYQAYIDESNVGKLALLNTESTPDKPTGTTMSMAVKPADFRRFTEEAKTLFTYWSIQPTFEPHLEIDKTTISKAMDFGSWYITRRRYFNSTFVALVDEIPYPINMELIKGTEEEQKDIEANYFRFIDGRADYGQYVFVFKVNDIQVSASRDELDYTEDNLEMLKKLIREKYEEYMKRLTDRYAVAKTYQEAVGLWRNDSERTGYLPRLITFRWDGMLLEDSFDTSDFVKDYMSKNKMCRKLALDTRDSKVIIDKPRVSSSAVLHFNPSYKGHYFFAHSTNKRLPSYFREWLAQNPDEEEMYVVFSDLMKPEEVEPFRKMFGVLPIEDINPNMKRYAPKKKKLVLDFSQVTYYSLVVLSRRRRRYSSDRYEVKKINGKLKPIEAGYIRYRMQYVSGSNSVYINGLTLDLHDALRVIKDFGVSVSHVYLVDKILGVEPTLTPVEKIFKDYFELYKDKVLCDKNGATLGSRCSRNWKALHKSGSAKNRIIDKTGPFWKYFEASMIVDGDRDSYSSSNVDFHGQHDFIKKHFPTEFGSLKIIDNLDVLHDAFENAYPLLNNYNIPTSNGTHLDHVYRYINQIDEELKKERMAKALSTMKLKTTVLPLP